MEAAYSLMQLAKTSVKLAQLAEAKLPYIHYVQIRQLEVQLPLTRC
jgi:acetyl-CoA carboxylase beta subunit